MVRLDAFLKNVGLFKSRSQAKNCCDAGRARLCDDEDDRALRGSEAVRVGSCLRIETATQVLRLEVLQVPARPVARSKREECIRVLEREPVAAEVLSFDDDA